ncbi:hypothetical protein Patl1_19632 [Pistacia atlantica]|uniref:Uncharacterized protein n=1 Tax=Pistacia atlantica TaxID=434234 RepID=A0ACC1BXY5_9ROSI|nr:hypothetical protein Patl1_19632 [Pistacia atlantica]
MTERARKEAELLRDEGKVEDKMVIELSRVWRLMEMDMVIVKAAVKEKTLGERLKQAKARCKQAILVANSFRTILYTHDSQIQSRNPSMLSRVRVARAN